MTRKDYIAIASALNVNWNAQSMNANGRILRAVILDCAESIATAMRADNPRFDRVHFLAVVRGERDPNSRPPRRVSAVKRDGCLAFARGYHDARNAAKTFRRRVPSDAWKGEDAI